MALKIFKNILRNFKRFGKILRDLEIFQKRFHKIAKIVNDSLKDLKKFS